MINHLAIWLYTRLVKLYPAPFRAEFEEEMVDIFTQRLADSPGVPSTLHVCAREFGDLPVSILNSHLKKQPGGKRMDNRTSLNLLRLSSLIWVVVGFSRVRLALTHSSLVFVLLALLSLSAAAGLLIAWRWTRQGGYLALGSGLLSMLVFMGAVLLTYPASNTKPFAVLLAGLFGGFDMYYGALLIRAASRIDSAGQPAAS